MVKKSRSVSALVLFIALFVSSQQAFSQTCLPTYSCSLTATASTSTWPCAAGGNVTVNAQSGTAPYTYQWSPSVSSSNSASNLAPGTYSITVTDATVGAPGPELVVNGDFSLGNTGFTTSYTYCNSALCLYPAAYYSVGTNPQFYHNQFWGSDHTTGTGNFMIINGDDVLNGVIWSETVTVTPNTLYVFSAWLSTMNTFPGITLQFAINGVPVGTTFAAPTQINQWKQFCESWNSGSNTTAVISIINKSLINVGNDCGLDDISFRGTSTCSTTVVVNIPQQPGVLSSVASANIPCYGGNNGSATAMATAGTSPFNFTWNTTPPQNSATVNNLAAGSYTVLITDANGCTSTQTVAITEPPVMNIATSSTPAGCNVNDGTADVTATGGTTPYTYAWLTTPPQAGSSIGNLAPGTYNVIVTDANGCSQTQSAAVNTGGNYPSAAFNMSEDSLDMDNPTVTFTDQSSNAFSWEWDFGDGSNSTLQDPAHTYSATGKYCITLVVRDVNGVCLDSTVQCLDVFAEFSFYISNAFTPTGDWNNELFFGKGRGIKNYNIWLFDRWGNMIWKCDYTGESAAWDNAGQDGMPSACKWDGVVVSGGPDMNGRGGELVQQDVYVWKVKLTDIFNKEHEYIGHVSVIR